MLLMDIILYLKFIYIIVIIIWFYLEEIRLGK